MATITLTGKNVAEVCRAAKLLGDAAAASNADNRIVDTLTLTDASPMVLSVTKNGVTTTTSI